MRLVGSAIIIAVAILGFAAIAQQTGTGGKVWTCRAHRYAYYLPKKITK